MMMMIDDANDANNTNFPMMVIANNILKQSYPPSLHKHIKRKTKKTQPSYIDSTTRKLTTWFVFLVSPSTSFTLLELGRKII